MKRVLRMGWMVTMVVAGVVLSGLGGCANRNTCNDIAMVREILDLAQHDQVEGNLQMHLNGDLEAGMRNGFYFGSPGTVVQANLAFKIKDVKSPTTKPAGQTTVESPVSAEKH
jgi:hypothetical protein